MGLYDYFYGQTRPTNTNPFLNQQTGTFNTPSLAPSAQPTTPISPMQVSAPADPSLPGVQQQNAFNAGIGAGPQCPTGYVWNPQTNACEPMSQGGSSGGGGAAPAGENPYYTTYGGHRDIAHANIDKAFNDFGAQITAGTAKNEDNPAFNQNVADRAGEELVHVGGGATKKAKDLTSEDFQGAAYDNLSYEEKMAAQYAALAAGGVKNVGGGYNQPDTTNVLQDIYGGLQVAARDLQGSPFGGIIGAIAPGFGKVIDTFADKAPAASTYDPTGGNTITTSRDNDRPSAAQQAASAAAASRAASSSGGPGGGHDGSSYSYSAPSKTESYEQKISRGGGFNQGGMVDPGLAMAIQSTSGYNKGGMYNYGGAVMMQDGGMTPGQPMAPSGMREGPQHDTTPAMLTPGEFVLDEDSTAAINQMAPGMLEQLNNWEPKDGPGMLMSLFDSLDDVSMTKTDKMGNKITVKSPEGTRMKTMFG